MGYRWECLECDYVTWSYEQIKERHRHGTITGHKMTGGADVWKHPTGSYYKYIYETRGTSCKECTEYYGNKQ